MLDAGDWWYETFIVPQLMERFTRFMEESPTGSILVGAFATSSAFAIGWLIFGFSSFRAAIFPRAESILMMFGGITGAIALTDGSQIPLTIGIGWIGVVLIRSHSHEAR